MTRRLSFSYLMTNPSVAIWGMVLILSVLCSSISFADDMSGGAVPPPGASYEQTQPSLPPPAAAGEIVADKLDFRILSAGAVMLNLQVGDNDGYGYGLVDGATLPRTSDPYGDWFFDNRTSAERTHPYAVATDHERIDQRDYTLVHSYDPAWFSTIDSAFYVFDVSGLQQLDRCSTNPTGRSHLLFDGVEQQAFLNINQGTFGSGVYKYPVSVKSILADGRLDVFFDQHNDCPSPPYYGDVWAIDYAALQVYGQEAPVPIPTPQLPNDGATVGSPRPTLTWSKESVQYYTLQISTSPDFANPTTYGKIASNSFTVPQTLANGKYYWRVAGQSIFGTGGSYSGTSAFILSASLVVPTNFQTIQAAVNAASDGDTIFVEPGTYLSTGNADFTINSLSSVVIMSTGGAASTIIQSDAASYGINLYFVSDFRFVGFTISGSLSNYNNLLTLNGPVGVRITDCVFENAGGTAIYAYGYDVIGDFTVDNCEFRNCNGHGVYSGGPHVVINNCLFEGNSYGFDFQAPGYKAGTAAATIALTGTSFVNSTYSGVIIWDIAQVTVDGCTFDGNGDGGLWLWNNSVATVNGCQFRNNSTVEWASGGIGVLYGSSLTLSNSLFENNFGYDAGAVYFGYMAQNLGITGCSFIGNERGAVLIDNGGGKAPEKYKDHPVPTNASPNATITIDASNFNYNRVNPPVYLRYVSSPLSVTLTCCNISGNEAGDWTGYIADQVGQNGNTGGDPLFCDTTGGNYTVAENSPLVAGSCGKIGLVDVGCAAVQFALSADSLYFDAVKGEGNPPSQQVTISNLGGSTLPWTRGPIPTWLNVSPTSGTAPTDVTFGVITGFQNIGVYVDTVEFSSDNAQNSPVDVIVVLNLRSPNSPPVIDSLNGVATAAMDTLVTNIVEGGHVHAIIHVTDPDEDPLTLSILNKPTAAQFVDNGDGTGSFQWTTYDPPSDTNVVRIIADDGVYADTITFIIVIQLNTPPMFTTTFTNGQVIEGQEYVLDMVVSDPDAQNCFISWNGQPAGGVFTDYGNRSAHFTFAPTYADVGQTYNVSFIATDSIESDTASFTLTVLNNVLKVQSASPSPGGTSSDVLVNEVIRVDFNELLDESSIAGNVSVASAKGQALSVQPGVDESGSVPTSYVYVYRNELKYRSLDQITLQIGTGVTDLSGYAIDKSYSFTFWTGVTVNPGDMTNDGVVNERDVLPLGIYWGKTGPARATQSIAWNSFATHVFVSGQKWEPYQAVYADADGNGRVEGADICAITDNWHAKLTSQPSKTDDVVQEVKESFSGMAASSLSELYQAALECEPSAGRVVVLKGLEQSMGLGSESLPTDFTLYQNYPNPFNPSTMIRFYLPEASLVRLSVYNLLGQEVSRLVDGHRDQGFTEVEWDGSDSNGKQVASGMYFYRLTTDSQRLTKRMMLVK